MLRPSAVMRLLLGGDRPSPRPISSPVPIRRTPVLVYAEPLSSTHLLFEVVGQGIGGLHILLL